MRCLTWASNLGLLVVIALVLVRYLPRVPDSFRAGAGLVSVVIVLAALGGGWIIGGPCPLDPRRYRSGDRDTRERTGASDRSGFVPVEARRGRCDRNVWIFSVLLRLVTALVLRRRSGEALEDAPRLHPGPGSRSA
jgi:hypothetical protein